MNKFMKRSAALAVLAALTLGVGASALAAQAEINIKITDKDNKQQQPKQQQAKPQEKPKQQQVKPQEQPKQQQARPQEQPKQQQAKPKEQPKQQQAKPKEQPKQQQAKPKEQPKQQQAKPKEQPKQQQAKPQPKPQPHPVYNHNGQERDNRIKVEMYNGNTTARSNTLYPRFKFTNTSNKPIRLSDVKFVYYYKLDKQIKQNYWCDWSNIGSDKVTGRFYNRSGECCFEGGFRDSSGYLQPGQSVEAHIRIAKDDWSNYNQKDHYSFNINATKYTEWGKIDITIGK